MKKKIVIGLAALGTAVALVPLFAAFEAHVINVTAKIENALSVPVTPIAFGTVFPQEQLERPLSVRLSTSFIAETNADDVNYIIRQKPKCGVTNQDGDPPDNGTQLVGPTWTGHVIISDNPYTNEEESYYIDCDIDRPDEVLQHPNPEFWLLPSLCPYLSKHPDGTPEPSNDGSLNSFHQAWAIATTTQNPFGGADPVVVGSLVWNDTPGRLAKSDSDFDDIWKIDLKVPCFGGFCAQDWANFVTGINPGANPDDYTQPIANEHKVFGCNLWVEVTGVSRLDPEQDICTDGIDNDGDGLIDAQDGNLGGEFCEAAPPQ